MILPQRMFEDMQVRKSIARHAKRVRGERGALRLLLSLVAQRVGSIHLLPSSASLSVPRATACR
jgi:hypothetical protein